MKKVICLQDARTRVIGGLEDYKLSDLEAFR